MTIDQVVHSTRVGLGLGAVCNSDRFNSSFEPEFRRTQSRAEGEVGVKQKEEDAHIPSWQCCPSYAVPAFAGGLDGGHTDFGRVDLALETRLLDRLLC